MAILELIEFWLFRRALGQRSSDTMAVILKC
jgi:hypothetical protein